MSNKVDEERLVVDIPKEYMEILDFIKSNIGVPKKGIISRALRDYLYKHRDVLRLGKLEIFLESYLEGK